MGSGWENPGPARQVVIAGPKGLLLVYSPSPGPGNLLVAIAGQGGTDKYGNNYSSGLTIQSPSQGIIFQDNTLPNSTSSMTSVGISSSVDWSIFSLLSLEFRSELNMFLQSMTGTLALESSGILSLLSDTARITLDANTQIIITSGTDLTLKSNTGVVHVSLPPASTGIQIGAGPIGKYYQEKITVDPAQVFLNNTLTVLTNYTSVKLRSSYGSAWNLVTGLWTCPETGPYRFTCQLNWGAWVAGSRGRISILNNTTGNVIADIDITQIAISGHILVCAEDEVTLNDIIIIQGLQATAANKSLLATSYIHIARTL